MVLRISRPDELVLRAPTGQFSPRDAHAARLAPLPTAACPVTGYEVIEPLAREAGEDLLTVVLSCMSAFASESSILMRPGTGLFKPHRTHAALRRHVLKV